MKKILVFGASNSKHSINRKLAIYASSLLESFDKIILDLNDFEMPIYSIDREKETGIPNKAKEFKDFVLDADGIIISFAEHNGSYSAAFKNIMDWVSRLTGDTWGGKKMLLMATSPGKRGGSSVLSTASGRFPFMGAEIIGEFSLPNFGMNFSEAGDITDVELKAQLITEIDKFASALAD
jgi:NAD(P)H-dependent FMN reductase